LAFYFHTLPQVIILVYIVQMWSSRLGVGREANNLTSGKTALFRNLIDAKKRSELLERHGRGKGLKNEIWMATWNVLPEHSRRK
jgi:hypothetical protein